MILVADNLTGANPRVRQALMELNSKPLQDLARRCQEAGARYLDLNPGYLSGRYEDRLAFMVEAVQKVTELPLVLDSPQPRVLARGLKECQKTPILNALTLEPAKLEALLPLAREHKTPLVLLLLDEKSFPPPTFESKATVALKLRQRALAAGLSEPLLIYDPVIPHLSWPEAGLQLGEGVKLVRALASGALLGEPAATLAALSNLRSGCRHSYGPEWESMALLLLAGAGLTYVMADVLLPETVNHLRLLAGVLGKGG